MNNVSDRTKVLLQEVQFLAADEEALGSRLASIANWIIDFLDKTPAIGTIRPSNLSQTQFYTLLGTSTTWVLADGRAVPGSSYAALIGANVPDLTNRHLRGKNNGRSFTTGDTGGDFALGTVEASQILAHSHPSVADVDGGRTVAQSNGTNDAKAGASDSLTPTRGFVVTNLVGTTGAALPDFGTAGANLIPPSIYVNFFIRIN